MLVLLLALVLFLVGLYLMRLGVLGLKSYYSTEEMTKRHEDRKARELLRLEALQREWQEEQWAREAEEIDRRDYAPD